MRKTFRVFLLIGLASALCIIMGCEGAYTGGGWIDGVGGSGKANFGFNAEAEYIDRELVVTGQLQFKDTSFKTSDLKPLRIHGKIEDVDIIDFTFLGEDYLNVGKAEGPYRSQPKGLTGTFEVWTHDGGKPGPSKEDWVIIELDGGIIYSNAGFLRGGSIKYHPPDDAAPGSRPSGTTWGAIKSR